MGVECWRYEPPWTLGRERYTGMPKNNGKHLKNLDHVNTQLLITKNYEDGSKLSIFCETWKISIKARKMDTLKIYNKLIVSNFVLYLNAVIADNLTKKNQPKIAQLKKNSRFYVQWIVYAFFLLIVICFMLKLTKVDCLWYWKFCCTLLKLLSSPEKVFFIGVLHYLRITLFIEWFLEHEIVRIILETIRWISMD